jgi:hypothetical protein
MRNTMRRAVVILGALILLLPAMCFGQDRTTTSTVKSTPPTSKPGKETTCDGALEIVPSQPLTFARKRRPAKNTPPTSQTKAEKKQDGETQN